MKKSSHQGTASAGRRILRLAVGSVPDGQWQNYRVFSERQPASINLDVSNRPIGSLLYSYGGMIITNNERWEIACSGSEPGGFQSIGGSRVGPAGDGKPDIYSIDRLRALVTASRWGTGWH